MAFLDAQSDAAQKALDALALDGNNEIAFLQTQHDSDQSLIGTLTARVTELQNELAAVPKVDAEIVDPVMVFDDLHLRTDWVKRVGSGIGGHVPTTYTWKQVPNPVPAPNSVASTVLQLDIAGGPYSDWLDALAVHSTLPQKKMRVVMGFKLMPDSRAAAAAQAIETDSKIIVASPDGTQNLYDLSFQCLYAKAGMLQLWNPETQSWFDSGIAVGKFAAMQWRHVEVEYEIDPASKQYHYISYLLDGTRYDLRSSPLRTAKPSTWTPGFVMQLQEDTNASQSGAYTLWVDRAYYEVYVL